MRLIPTLTAVAILAGPVAASAQDLERFDTIEKAVESTKASKKDILVYFTGSDWSEYDIKLDKEVFSQDEWKKQAASKYVLVLLDFPQGKAQSEAQMVYNKGALKKYGIEGYPQVLLLTSDGGVYAQTSYKAGGAAAYLEHLAGFADRRAAVADLAGRMARNPADFAARDELLNKAEEWDLLPVYLEMKMKAAATAGSSQGRHAADLAFYYHKEKRDEEKYAKFLEDARKADAAEATTVEDLVALNKELLPVLNKDWERVLELVTPHMAAAKGRLAQDAYWWAGAAEMRLRDDKEKAIELMEKALTFAPYTKRAVHIRSSIKQIRSRMK